MSANACICSEHQTESLHVRQQISGADMVSGGKKMSDYTRSGEADELREQLSKCHDYIAELEAECKELKKGLQEMSLEVEHKRQMLNEEQLKQELRYRDGMIAGLKYAIRCNGVSGGEVS